MPIKYNLLPTSEEQKNSSFYWEGYETGFINGQTLLMAVMDDFIDLKMMLPKGVKPPRVDKTAPERLKKGSKTKKTGER